MIGEATSRDLNQPAARIVRQTVFRPLKRGRQQSLLYGIFGGTEIAEAMDHRAEDLRCELTQQVLVGEIRRSSRHTSTGGALIT